MAENGYSIHHLPGGLEPLTKLPIWVCWKWETRKGKPTKVPYQPGGSLAESDNPQTWAGYGDVLRAVNKFDGIGFCLLGQDLPAFDLDGCRDRETGEVKPIAMGLVERCRSYTEVTPSGTGLRIIGRGTGGRIQKKYPLGDGVTIEPYRNTERYITVTGDALAGYDLPLANIDTIMDDVVRDLEERRQRKPKGSKKKGRATKGGTEDEDELWRTIRDGGQGRHGSTRSEQDWYVINEMFRRGNSAASILRVLLDPKNGISAHVRDQANPEQYARHEVEKARAELELQSDENGKAYKSQTNIRLALAKMRVALSYDQFADRALVEGLPGFGPALDDAAVRRLWLAMDQRYRLQVSQELAWAVVEDTARVNAFHPVRDYLGGLKWDGTKRIDKWLVDYAQAEDTPYVRAVGRLLLVAAVRRVRKPGCKFDEMPVLENPTQGTNKSTALAILAVREEWFTDDLPLNAETKRVIEALRGHWIVEAGELSGMKRGDIEHLKAMLSRRRDQARMAFGRLVSEAPRECVMVGTTNDEEYLKDQTGNRRFWPVRVGTFDLDRLLADRDQLWAEAAAMEAKGESIRLDPSLWPAAEVEQAKRLTDDPWDERLGDLFGDIEGKISAQSIFSLLDIQPLHQTQEVAKRLSNVMRRLGWRRPNKAGTIREEGRMIAGYVRGDPPWDPVVVSYDREERRFMVEPKEKADQRRQDQQDLADRKT